MRTSANSILQVNFSGTLPVLLNSFTAKAVQQDVQLDWQTMMEQNSKSFIPEHSADGRQWRKLHEIPASGNSQEKKEYSYLHRRPGAGIHYYRLLQIDLDGKQTHSEVRRVHINDLSKLRIVPNPAIADVVVQRDKSDEVEIIVFDAVGSTVYRTKTSGSSITLPASGWSAGLYRISIQGKESKQMLSFVKE